MALAGLALGGCGGGGSSRPLSISQLPLVSGATVVTQERQCDPGANGYCAIQAVIADPRAGSSGALVEEERRRLRRLGWSDAAGDNGKEHAADSPGHRLRVTYATAYGDLLGWDEGWIKRSRTVVLALDRQYIEGIPAMSVMLEVGPA